jgi:hypothetical protein
MVGAMVNMISVVAGFTGMIEGVDWLVTQSLSLGNNLAIGSAMALYPGKPIAFARRAQMCTGAARRHRFDVVASRCPWSWSPPSPSHVGT